MLKIDMELQGRANKNPAKFGDTCSVRAEGLCIGCLGQWAERGREIKTCRNFFALPCKTLAARLKGIGELPSHSLVPKLFEGCDIFPFLEN